VLIIALEIVHDTEAGCPARISPTIISPYYAVFRLVISPTLQDQHKYATPT